MREEDEVAKNKTKGALLNYPINMELQNKYIKNISYITNCLVKSYVKRLIIPSGSHPDWADAFRKDAESMIADDDAMKIKMDGKIAYPYSSIRGPTGHGWIAAGNIPSAASTSWVGLRVTALAGLRELGFNSFWLGGKKSIGVTAKSGSTSTPESSAPASVPAPVTPAKGIPGFGFEVFITAIAGGIWLVRIFRRGAGKTLNKAALENDKRDGGFSLRNLLFPKKEKVNTIEKGKELVDIILKQQAENIRKSILSAFKVSGNNASLSFGESVHVSGGDWRIVYVIPVILNGKELQIVAKAYMENKGLKQEIKLLRFLNKAAKEKGIPCPVPQFIGHFKVKTPKYPGLSGDIIMEQFVGKWSLPEYLSRVEDSWENKLKVIKNVPRNLIDMYLFSKKMPEEGFKFSMGCIDGPMMFTKASIIKSFQETDKAIKTRLLDGGVAEKAARDLIFTNNMVLSLVVSFSVIGVFDRIFGKKRKKEEMFVKKELAVAVSEDKIEKEESVPEEPIFRDEQEAMKWRNISIEEAKKDAEKTGRKTLIYFAQDINKCLACKMMQQEVFSDVKLQKLLNDNFICVKTESGEDRLKYGVDSTPVLIFTDSIGKEIYPRIIGGRRLWQIQTIAANVMSGVNVSNIESFINSMLSEQARKIIKAVSEQNPSLIIETPMKKFPLEEKEDLIKEIIKYLCMYRIGPEKIQVFEDNVLEQIRARDEKRWERYTKQWKLVNGALYGLVQPFEVQLKKWLDWKQVFKDKIGIIIRKDNSGYLDEKMMILVDALEALTKCEVGYDAVHTNNNYDNSKFINKKDGGNQREDVARYISSQIIRECNKFFKHPFDRALLGTEWDENHVRLQNLRYFMARVKKGEKIIGREKYNRDTLTLEEDIVNLEGVEVVILAGLYAVSNEDRLGNLYMRLIRKDGVGFNDGGQNSFVISSRPLLLKEAEKMDGIISNHIEEILSFIKVDEYSIVEETGAKLLEDKSFMCIVETLKGALLARSPPNSAFIKEVHEFEKEYNLKIFFIILTAAERKIVVTIDNAPAELSKLTIHEASSNISHKDGGNTEESLIEDGFFKCTMKIIIPRLIKECLEVNLNIADIVNEIRSVLLVSNIPAEVSSGENTIISKRRSVDTLSNSLPFAKLQNKFTQGNSDLKTDGGKPDKFSLSFSFKARIKKIEPSPFSFSEGRTPDVVNLTKSEFTYVRGNQVIIQLTNDDKVREFGVDTLIYKKKLSGGIGLDVLQELPEKEKIDRLLDNLCERHPKLDRDCLEAMYADLEAKLKQYIVSNDAYNGQIAKYLTDRLDLEGTPVFVVGKGWCDFRETGEGFTLKGIRVDDLPVLPANLFLTPEVLVEEILPIVAKVTGVEYEKLLRDLEKIKIASPRNFVEYMYGLKDIKAIAAAQPGEYAILPVLGDGFDATNIIHEITHLEDSLYSRLGERLSPEEYGEGVAMLAVINGIRILADARKDIYMRNEIDNYDLAIVAANIASYLKDNELTGKEIINTLEEMGLSPRIMVNIFGYGWLAGKIDPERFKDSKKFKVRAYEMAKYFGEDVKVLKIPRITGRNF